MTATPESLGMSAARLQRLDAAMQRYVDRGLVAGVVTLLARHGQLVHRGCYGQMDLDSARPMREDALFRIFSMTKPITSLAVMMLFEEGYFQLGFPVSLFLPEFAGLTVLSDPANIQSERLPLERPITIVDLLTHSSGLAYGLDRLTPLDAAFADADMLRMDESLAEKITRIAEFPLHHQPGLRHTYSIATDVLGRLVEVISGERLDQFFQHRIFEPLGMEDTAFSVPPEKLERLAALYTPAPGGGLLDLSRLEAQNNPSFIKGAWVDKRQVPAFLSGGAGLVSRAADYMRFAQMLANHGTLDGVRLLGRKTLELMTSPHLRPEQFFIPGASYGLGLTVLTDPARTLLPASPGSYGGGGAAHTDFWVDPGEELCGVLMVQYASPNPLPLGLDFKVLAEQAIVD